MILDSFLINKIVFMFVILLIRIFLICFIIFLVILLLNFKKFVLVYFNFFVDDCIGVEYFKK